MKYLLLLIIFITIALFEIPGLVKKNYWRELVIFSLMLTFDFILYFLLIMGVDFPSITTALIQWIKPLYNL